MSKVGINGFGRIGRLVLRRLLEVKSNIDVVAINDLTSPKFSAYLLKHDLNDGPSPLGSVDFTEDSLIVDGKSISVYAEKEAKIFRGKRSGRNDRRMYWLLYLRQKSQAHLDAGAKKVLISAPAGELENDRL